MSDALMDVMDTTLNDIVTATKLQGSLLVLKGWTTPENWPFAVVVTVEKPEHGGEMSKLVLRLQEDALEVAPIAAANVVKAWP